MLISFDVDPSNCQQSSPIFHICVNVMPFQNSSLPFVKNVLYFALQLTMADLAVHDIFTTFLQKNKSILDKYPKLLANRKAVEANPKLAEYLKERPETIL